MIQHLQGITKHGVACMLLASIGAILFGFDNGWWGTILGSPRFLKDYGSCAMVEGVEVCNLSTPQLSAGSSVQSAGIMVGCLMAAYINNIIGRRWSLVLSAIISLTGVTIEATSAIGSPARYTQFVVGKVIASIAMGMVVNIVPVYLSETSPPAARGFAISLYQNVQIIGVIVAAGCVFATSVRNDPSSYLIPMCVQAIAPGIMLLVTPLIPESPRWLVLKGRMPEAQLAAQKLFGTNGFDPEEYCTKLAIAFEEEKQTESSTSWADLLRNPDRRRLLIAVGIQCLQQAQGSSYMNSYVVSFLQSNGITNVFPVIMGLYSLYYVAILTGHFLPDMYGRRIILMTTGAFCAACLLIVAIMTTVITVPTKTTANAAIALIFLWEFSFGVQSPLIWIVTAESAPTRNREKVLSMATFWGFGVSLLITSVSPYLQNEGYGNLGSKIVSASYCARYEESADGKGFIWGAFSVVTVVWVFFIVPECKGFSLEQLDHLFAENVPTRAFGSYKFTDDVLSVAVKEGDEEAAGIDKDEKDLSSTYVQGLDQK